MYEQSCESIVIINKQMNGIRPLDMMINNMPC